MGEFKAGTTTIWLLAYFFAFMVILHGVAVSSAHYGVSNPSSYQDTGFGSAIVGDDLNTSVSSSTDTQNFATIWTSIGFALGFNNSVQLGIPSQYLWMIRFFLVWLPGIYLLICLYFMIPLFH